jgi:hypothetical protein
LISPLTPWLAKLCASKGFWRFDAVQKAHYKTGIRRPQPGRT